VPTCSSTVVTGLVAARSGDALPATPELFNELSLADLARVMLGRLLSVSKSRLAELKLIS